MEAINPGIVLPIYRNTTSSRNRLAKHRNKPSAGEFNWFIPVAYGESISLQFPVTPDWYSYTTWYLLDENEDILDTLDLSYLRYSEDANGNAWFSYFGNSPELNNLACGVYSFEFYNSGTGARYYSEDFRVMGLDGKKNAYRLTFYHSTEVDGILYQLGLQQQVWLLDAILDTPEIVQPTETITDGNAVEVLTFQSVQRREVLKFPYMPDFWQGTLHRVRMLDSVALRSLESGNDYDISGASIDFSSEDQDIIFKKGVLSWVSSTQVMGGCEENRELILTNVIAV